MLQDIPLNPDIVARTHFDFLTPEWIDNMCKFVGNCSDQQPEFAVNWKNRIRELNEGTLSDIINSRLGTHISEFGDQLDINDGCWRFHFEIEPSSNVSITENTRVCSR